jgi:hypothetical protein
MTDDELKTGCFPLTPAFGGIFDLPSLLWGEEKSPWPAVKYLTKFKIGL